MSTGHACLRLVFFARRPFLACRGGILRELLQSAVDPKTAGFLTARGLAVFCIFKVLDQIVLALGYLGGVTNEGPYRITYLFMLAAPIAISCVLLLIARFLWNNASSFGPESGGGATVGDPALPAGTWRRLIIGGVAVWSIANTVYYPVGWIVWLLSSHADYSLYASTSRSPSLSGVIVFLISVFVALFALTPIKERMFPSRLDVSELED